MYSSVCTCMSLCVYTPGSVQQCGQVGWGHLLTVSVEIIHRIHLLSEHHPLCFLCRRSSVHTCTLHIRYHRSTWLQQGWQTGVYKRTLSCHTNAAHTHTHTYTHTHTHLSILLNIKFELHGQHLLLLLYWEGGINGQLKGGAGDSLSEEGQYQVHILQGWDGVQGEGGEEGSIEVCTYVVEC